MSKRVENELIENQKGQSLVEFMLLLAIIVGISFAFMSGLNRGVAARWSAIANTLLVDTDNNETLELR